jgi:hypothetical protein
MVCNDRDEMVFMQCRLVKCDAIASNCSGTTFGPSFFHTDHPQETLLFMRPSNLKYHLASVP